MALFRLKRHSPNRALTQLLARLSDEQFSLLLTGDCWELRDDCVCRSFRRFDLQLKGLVTVHGRFTALGSALQAAPIDD